MVSVLFQVNHLLPDSYGWMREADLPLWDLLPCTMEKALLPLTITSDPRPFNQQLPEPPDLRCALEPQGGLELAPALVCALCCCFGIIYCCFGEGRAWGAAPKTVVLQNDANFLPCSGHSTSSVRVFHTASASLCYLPFFCLLPQNPIPSCTPHQRLQLSSESESVCGDLTLSFFLCTVSFHLLLSPPSPSASKCPYSMLGLSFSFPCLEIPWYAVSGFYTFG